MSKWFKGAISTFTVLIFLSCHTSTPAVQQDQAQDFSSILVSPVTAVAVTDYFGSALSVFDAPNLTISEKRVRSASVKVETILKDGHGSGTYMVMYGKRVVVTAAHVTNGSNTMLIRGRENETVIGRVVFEDVAADIAFLVVPKMETRTAIRCRPYLSYDERLIGAGLTYTGFPSHHDLLTVRGYITSLERGYVVANMFGWFGSSGSGVFDNLGRLVGVVSGIDVGRFMMPIPIEEIVWVAPMSLIDMGILESRIKAADPVGVLHAFPGAKTPRRGTVRDGRD